MKQSQNVGKKDEAPPDSKQDESTAGPSRVSPSASPEPGPPAPPVDQDEVEPEFDPDDMDDTAADLPEFPVTHELKMKDHTKVVSALAVDPSGARVVSGSYDYDCKLWDFGGMSATVKPFKTWEPAETYYVRSCGDYFFKD